MNPSFRGTIRSVDTQEAGTLDWLERHRLYLFLLLLLIVALGAGLFYYRQAQPGALEIVLSTPTPPPPREIAGHVSGAVTRPDVYTLRTGDRVKDAIEAAGGPTAEADLEQLNLAVRVKDEQRIYVPRRGEAIPSSPQEAAVNVNTDPAEKLETLPGIGPTKAKAIVEFRSKNGPFKRAEDLNRVPGIGPATVERLRGLITLD